jgi:hypothetical protein
VQGNGNSGENAAVVQTQGGNTAPNVQQQAAVTNVADQPAPTQQAVAPGGNSVVAPSVEQPANSGVGDVSVDLVVIGTETYTAKDVQVTTLANGQILTLAGGKTITGNIIALASTSKPVPVKTATVGKTDLTGNNTLPATGGLSKQATVGLGVGLGVFGSSLIASILGYKWWSKRKRSKSRTPSIIISAPLEAKSNFSETGSQPDSPTEHMRELDGAPKIGELSHADALSAISRRSPVSPYTPGTATTASASPTGRPNIYEMMGSEPQEMSAAPAAAEVESPQPAQELDSAGTAESRPFSFVQTPVEAFVPMVEKKKPIAQSGGETVREGDNGV